MSVNGTITQSTWTDTTLTSPRAQYISEIRSAIDRLAIYRLGVTNCDFTNYCQACQSQTCQTLTCQTCQTCQVCQSATSLVECRQKLQDGLVYQCHYTRSYMGNKGQCLTTWFSGNEGVWLFQCTDQARNCSSGKLNLNYQCSAGVCDCTWF